MDEAAMVHRVMGNLERGDLDPRGEFNYGAFYPTLATGVLAGLRVLGVEPTEKRTALTCRIISWLSYLGILALVFAILRRLAVSRDVSLWGVVLLGSGPDLHYWAQHIHPDVLQAFLIVLAFWTVARAQNWRWAVLAAFVCGVAFGTKYSGIFAVGFVLLPALLVTVGRKSQLSLDAPLDAAPFDASPVNAATLDAAPDPKPHASSGGNASQASRPYTPLALMGWLAASGIAFLAGWIMFNPYVLTSTHEFWHDLQFERVHLGYGHYMAEPRNPLLWFAIWFREIRPAGAWLVALGLVLAIMMLLPARFGRGELTARSSPRRRLSSADHRFLWIVGAYVAVCMIHLGATVVMRRMRYALHFWPLVFVLAGYGLDRGLIALRQQNGTLVRTLAHCAWLVAAICGIGLGLSTTFSRTQGSAGVEDPIFAAAEWMVERYAPSTPIVADAYFYRHPRFQNLHVVPGVQPRNLIEHGAYVVVLLERTSGRASWKEPGTRFADQRFVLGARADSEAIQQFHRELAGPSSPYEVAYETESVVVLELKDDVFKTDSPTDHTP